ncbi:MAG: HAD family phosphatase [Armatimonadetes bacterium]|nr:HAD family phosphatase [Armatimonadota bacterium]
MTRALIFDFDGVIVNSEPVQFEVFRDLLAEEGIAITAKEYEAGYLALDDRRCFEIALARAGRPADPGHLDALVARKMARYEIARTRAPAVPGIHAFVRAADGHVALAIASGGFRSDIEALLAHHGLRSHFPVVVSIEDCRRGKPDPECLHACLSRLNAGMPTPILPAECVVIEDSFHGITAARAAGMRCIGVATTYPPERLAGAERVVATLEGLDPLGL